MVKLQSRKTGKNMEYEQYWIPLPKKVVESLAWEKGIDIEIFVERSDLVLRKV
jgi:hypothetical protein